jgi:GNAT superfamily N-acetyltransferase
VHPEHQRKGYGTFLVNEMLQYSESDNWPYYLETHEEKNIAFFNKFGFKLVETGRLPESDVNHWCMVKKTFSIKEVVR